MKKKFFLSLLIVAGFISYAILQSVNKVSGLLFDDDGPRSDENTERRQEEKVVVAPVPPANQSAAASQSNPAPTKQTPTNISSAPTPAPAKPATSGYRDGAYTGNPVDVYYGYVQVKAIISAGKIIDVQFLDYPQDRDTSRQISASSLPVLHSEAISAQNAQVNMVSGATETSAGFIKSLESALAKART